MFDWIAPVTPRMATLDSLRTLLWFEFYQRLEPKFQPSLSAVTLGICLCGFNKSKNKQGEAQGSKGIHEGAFVTRGKGRGEQVRSSLYFLFQGVSGFCRLNINCTVYAHYFTTTLPPQHPHPHPPASISWRTESYPDNFGSKSKHIDSICLSV